MKSIDENLWKAIGGEKYTAIAEDLLTSDVGLFVISEICRFAALQRKKREGDVIIRDTGEVLSPPIINCGLAALYGYDTDKIQAITADNTFKPGDMIISERDVIEAVMMQKLQKYINMWAMLGGDGLYDYSYTRDHNAGEGKEISQP